MRILHCLPFTIFTTFSSSHFKLGITHLQNDVVVAVKNCQERTPGKNFLAFSYPLPIEVVGQEKEGVLTSYIWCVRAV